MTSRVWPSNSASLRDATLTTVVGLCMGESRWSLDRTYELFPDLMDWFAAASPMGDTLCSTEY
ncbi:hypothetical protein FIBSPDRAFT_853471 [Athelia psychrophila]|uniref:Uncharacterized protein n=1 Tax=Athelia psychrophila TaxID=1759441 RepID=A0A166QVU4_9AGAM|nr:hypothetical protein FIBSPDRAFT_853471 [Fibularhizoctonia sp. CBS 109695]